MPSRACQINLRGATILMVALTSLAICKGPVAAPSGTQGAQALPLQARHRPATLIHSRAAFEPLQPGGHRPPSQQPPQPAFPATDQATSRDHRDRALRTYTKRIHRGANPDETARAQAALGLLQLQSHHYVRAYTLADSLAARMPKIHDPLTRRRVLKTLYRVQVDQGLYAAALRDARALQDMARTSMQRCESRVWTAQASIYDHGRQASARGDIDAAMAACKSAGLSGFTNELRLDLARLMVREGLAHKALLYLKTLRPMVVRSGLRKPLAALLAIQARAELEAGRYVAAGKAARAAIALHAQDPASWTLLTAYKTLYKVQEQAGHDRDALESFAKYAHQEKAAMARARAKALAYQMVRQDLLAKKLKLEEMSRQNQILQLRQSLDEKSNEMTRLYILILLVILVFLGLWAYRLKHSQVRYRRLARHDDLTGVCNRQYFFEQAERALQRIEDTGGQACLMILDMDYFKRINDVHGHVCGDRVLRHVARLCQDELRATDMFGRLGGEEFGILLPHCPIPRGIEIGERIRHGLAVSTVPIQDGTTVTVTASIGLACTEKHGHVLKSLLIAADEALYTAKRGGRNKLIIRTTKVAREP